MKGLHASIVGFGLGLAAASCTLLVDPQAGAGIGATCTTSDQCQGASCIDGLCSLHCGDSNQCPGGTVCASGSCQLPAKALLLLSSSTELDLTGEAFDRGLTEAEGELGYLEGNTLEDAGVASEAFPAAAAALGSGHQETLIVGSSSLASGVGDFAASHPELTVLAYQAPASEAAPNVVSFDTRTYQAYYLAGYAAARFATPSRMGFVGGRVSPSTVASINAFLLGAQRVDPNVVLEVRLLNEPHDTSPKVNGESRERRETRALIAGGATVVATNVDNNIPLFTVRDVNDEQGAAVFAVGANLRDACEPLSMTGRCVGSTYFQFGPLLASMIGTLHRQSLLSPRILEPIRLSDDDTAFGFNVGPSVGNQLTGEVDAIRADLAGDLGVGPAFAGPITSTGQCEVALGTSPCVPAGDTLDDESLAAMCWFVDGVIDGAGAPLQVPSLGECTD